MVDLVTNFGAFTTYTVVSSITPGPNNLMELNVGLTRGSAAAMRTAAGVSLGWGIQILVCGFGLGALISAIPGLHDSIEALGLAYLLWLALRLATSHHLAQATPTLGFFGAIRYQWINPKAISMALSLAALFVVHTAGYPLYSVLFVGIAAPILNYPCVCTWGVLGVTLANRLRNEHAVIRFNRITALTLLAMIVWVGLTAKW